MARDGEVLPQKELSSYFEELFSSKVPRQKELSSSNEEFFPNPGRTLTRLYCSGNTKLTLLVHTVSNACWAKKLMHDGEFLVLGSSG